MNVVLANPFTQEGRVYQGNFLKTIPVQSNTYQSFCINGDFIVIFPNVTAHNKSTLLMEVVQLMSYVRSEDKVPWA